jgi:hypothetical protein
MSSDEAEFDDGGEIEKKKTKTHAANDDDDMDDDEAADDDETSPSRKRRSSRGKSVSYKDVADDIDESDAEYDDEEEEEEEQEDDDDDSEDDDIPLAALKSPSPAKKKKNGTKAKAPPKKKAKKSTTTKKTSSTTKSSSGSSSDLSSPSAALYAKGIKGQLIQKLLCRWWYAITWPGPSAIPDKPLPNHDTMDGFPGLYVCTKGEEVGTIKDLRDKSKAPNFNNFAKMKSEELQALLVKAIKEQKRQLIDAEGAGTSTEKELDTMLKWAEKLNTAKADKEAATILKAGKFSLPE